MTEYKTYEHYSTEALLNLADAFRMAVRGINTSRFNPDALTLPADSCAVISASPNGGMRVCISFVEGVLEEAWGRVGLAKNVGRGVSVLSELECEVGRAIDRHLRRGSALTSYLDSASHSGGGSSSGFPPKKP